MGFPQDLGLAVEDKLYKLSCGSVSRERKHVY